MIRWFQRVLGRSREYDDDELAWSERRSDASDDAARRASVDRSDLRALRGTVDALRSVGPVKAPRSFALTEENLSAAGYSEQEVRRVLRPGMRRVPLWQRPVSRQLPLAMTALALLVGGYFILDDTDVLGPAQLTESPRPGDDTSIQVTVEAQLASAEVTVATEAYRPPETHVAHPQPAPTAEIVVTVQAFVAAETLAEEIDGLTETRVVEREVVITAETGVTVEVLRVVERETHQIETVTTSETVQAQVVEIEREVEAEVTRVVEREVVLETPVTMVTREADIWARDAEEQEMTTLDDRSATATPAMSGMVATVQPARPTMTDSVSGDEPVGVLEVSATPGPLAVAETALSRPTAGPTDQSETLAQLPGDTDPVRIWPSVVALSLALAGLVVWFELRRRRRMWE